MIAGDPRQRGGGGCAYRRLATFARRLRGDTSGVSLIEMALILPVLITLGMYGTEVAYMAVVNMQIGQIATSVADNASRLGQTDNSAVTPTVTEAQVDSVMTGALVEGAAFDFESNGRIILSSLEYNTTKKRQFIHWQRCRGDMKVSSAYGDEDPDLSGAKINGMGDPLVTTTANMAVMYVEVYYTYHPLFGTMFVGAPEFHREAAYLIRDDRNLTKGVTPGTTAAQSLCT